MGNFWSNWMLYEGNRCVNVMLEMKARVAAPEGTDKKWIFTGDVSTTRVRKEVKSTSDHFLPRQVPQNRSLRSTLHV